MDESSPFGSNAAISVGFSDGFLMIVSVAGFVFLAATIYSILILRLKTREEIEEEDLKDAGYEERLARADVATLSRAERRARARIIMKEQRRANVGERHPEEQDGEEEDHDVRHMASRKERQKAAKATEKEERRLFEEERRQLQAQAQAGAQWEKRQRQLEEAKRAEEEKRRLKLQQEAKERAEFQKYSTFLSTPEKYQSVEEWVAELRAKRFVHLAQVAASYGISSQQVRARIEQLLQERRVAGVFEKDGRFIYFSHDELLSIASQVKSLGEVSMEQVSNLCNDDSIITSFRPAAAIDLLNTDLLAAVFTFLSWNEVLTARVSQKWKDAATATPVTEIHVRKREIGWNLAGISRALPNTRAVKNESNFDVEDGDEAEPTLRLARMEGYEPPRLVDLTPIRNFSSLRHLNLSHTSLNGKYPFIFQFQHLQTLDLLWCSRLKWNLEMLSGLPNLQKLYCPNNHNLHGGLGSVRVLLLTLMELNLCNCKEVTGTLEDLYDFPVLQKLAVEGTKVTGDIRTIGKNDFKSIKELCIGDSVYGGFDINTIGDAPAIMFAWYRLMKIKGLPRMCRRWSLAEGSPERYRIHGHHSRAPPFHVEFVNVGPRMGWRWTNCVTSGACETNWLDPEPIPSDEGYDQYQSELENAMKEVDFYKGFLKPPTEEEHAQRSAEVPLDPVLRFGSPRISWGFHG